MQLFVGLGNPMTQLFVGLGNPGAKYASNRHNVGFMDMQPDVKPAFAPGDRVRTASHGIATHTRLPAYARGRVGTIESHHGTHVFADANALGDRRGEPIYTVVFEAKELWPDAKNPRDRISLDLWQSHLAPA